MQAPGLRVLPFTPRATGLVQTQLPSISYFDLAATWHVLKNLDIRAGVNNVLDKDPPIAVNPSLQGNGSANTFATYDTLGRQLYLAFTAKL